MRSRLHLLGFLLAALQGAGGAAAPVVTWVTPELTTDTNNFGEHYLTFLMGRLRGLDHRVLRGSLGRVWHEIETRVGTCVFNALKTPERQSFALYSRRPLLTPGYRFYFPAGHRAAFAPYLNRMGEIDLGKLAESPLMGGITAKRVYSPVIDGFIADRQRTHPLDSMVSTRQLLNLLESARIDFTFASPVDLEGEMQARLGSLAIAGENAWNATFIACTKDNTGQAVITAIDRVLQDDHNWAEFIEPLQTVLSPEDFAVALRSEP